MKIKKTKVTKKVFHKKTLKFQDYKNCLKAAQIENKISHLEKNKIDVDSIKENQKEFIENNTLILKTQQRFTSKRDNVFTEEINKTALISNDDKRMQSIDSIEHMNMKGRKKKEERNCKKEEIINYVIK